MEQCELCLVKQQLKMYEGVIVDSVTEQNVKIRENDTRRDVYSWKAPFQEAILKSKYRNQSSIVYPLSYNCNCVFRSTPPSNVFHTVILSHIRNTDIVGKEDGKTLLQLLDAFRNECKVRLYTHIFDRSNWKSQQIRIN